MSWDWIVEHKLQEAFNDGLFDHLPGAGRPLRWEDDALVPPAWRAAFHLLSQSGLAPAWVMIDVEIRKDQAAARQAFVRATASLDVRDPKYAMAVQRLADDLSRVNTSIDELNLCVPSPSLARARLNPGLEIERLRRAAIAGTTPVAGTTDSARPA